MTDHATRIAVAENDIKHICDDVKVLQADVEGMKKMMRWGMGAAAAMGAMLPLILPKLAEAIGL